MGTIEQIREAERVVREQMQAKLSLLESRVSSKKVLSPVKKGAHVEAREKVQNRKAALEEAAKKKEEEKIRQRAKKKKDQEEKDNLKSELEDMQHEFESDRQSYLDTMREQNRHI